MYLAMVCVAVCVYNVYVFQLFCVPYICVFLSLSFFLCVRCMREMMSSIRSLFVVCLVNGVCVYVFNVCAALFYAFFSCWLFCIHSGCLHSSFNEFSMSQFEWFYLGRYAHQHPPPG